MISDPLNKGSKFRGKFRSIFREKIRTPQKLFRAKFPLQTCHLITLTPVLQGVFHAPSGMSWFCPRHLLLGPKLLADKAIDPALPALRRGVCLRLASWQRDQGRLRVCVCVCVCVSV